MSTIDRTIDIPKLKHSADYLRYLALEGIERSTSGHPGLPLGCAEFGILLYRYLMNYNPMDPHWKNRDRFVLSAGHGSMFLYSLLYSAGFNLSLADLDEFRQLGGKTPGHPEYELELGIETTTGPLGQGIANAVGMAIEGKMMAQNFNEKGFEIFDYTVYTLLGDGCNMEGISYEAGSMAGHLGLDNLIAIYDSNQITIDGNTDITFTEDVGKRYEALGWYVDYADLSQPETVYHKLKHLKELKGKPKLLIMTTTIGEGLNKKRGSSGIHGSPAGAEEIAYFIQHSSIKNIFEEKYGKAVTDAEKLKEILAERSGKREPMLECPEHLEYMREFLPEAQERYDAWTVKFEAYKEAHPEKYKQLAGYINAKLPETLDEALLNYSEAKPDATRNIAGRLLNVCAAELTQMVGGCADLVGSTKASVKGSRYIAKDDFSGRNIAFGVREHAMGAIGNGLALNRNLIPFTSTFFTFFDYMKPAVRLAAMMKLNHLFIFSHDSIYVGEDGPTHQPIEHLNAIRLIPDLYTFRPANDVETAFSYRWFLKKMNGPAAIVTTRQNIAADMFKVSGDRKALYENFEKGGYVFYETEAGVEPDVVLCGTGSEVGVALEAGRLLEERENKKVRVVSIPCMELLNEQDGQYKSGLFNAFKAPVVFVESGSFRGVGLFYHPQVTLVNIDTFGASAPGDKVAEHFGITGEAVYQKISNK